MGKRNTDMIKSKTNTSISLKNFISKDMDTIIISTGIPPVSTTSTIIPML